VSDVDFDWVPLVVVVVGSLGDSRDVGVAQLWGFFTVNGITTASVVNDSDVGNFDVMEEADVITVVVVHVPAKAPARALVVIPVWAPVDMLASSRSSVSPLPLLRPKIVGVARLLRTAAAARTSSRELFLSCLRILGNPFSDSVEALRSLERSRRKKGHCLSKR